MIIFYKIIDAMSIVGSVMDVLCLNRALVNGPVQLGRVQLAQLTFKFGYIRPQSMTHELPRYPTIQYHTSSYMDGITKLCGSFSPFLLIYVLMADQTKETQSPQQKIHGCKPSHQSQPFKQHVQTLEKDPSLFLNSSVVFRFGISNHFLSNLKSNSEEDHIIFFLF